MNYNSKYLVEKQDKIDAESQNQGHVLECVKVTSEETNGLSDIFSKIHLRLKIKMRENGPLDKILALNLRPVQLEMRPCATLRWPWLHQEPPW